MCPLQSSKKLLFIALCLLFASGPLLGQNVIRQGVIDVEELSASPDLNGSPIVPPLTDEQGMVRITVEENPFFKADDVVEWLKSGRLTLQGLNFDRNRIIQTPDGAIIFRFNFRFLTGTDQVGRRMQIRIDNFQTYYKSHRFYKQQVVDLRLKVDEAPEFDKPLVQNGTLVVGLNVDGAEVIAIDGKGQEQGRRFAVGTEAKMDIPVGTYRLIIRKTGYEEAIRDNVRIRNAESTNEEVILNQLVVNRQQTQDKKTVVEFQTNADRTQITLLSQDGIQQGLIAFDKLARAEVRPGRFNVIASKDGFREQSFTLEVEEGAVNTRNIRMIRTGTATTFTITSSPIGANVFINDQKVGVTPHVIRSPEREIYNVRIEAKDFQTYREQVDFALENEFTINKRLTPSYIDFNAFTEKKRSFMPATVFVNGDSMGVSSFRFHNPPDSTYEISYKKRLYEDYSQSVDLTNVGFASLNIQMQKKRSTFKVANAKYEVPMRMQIFGVSTDTDSLAFERAEFDSTVKYGSYTISLSRPGFKPQMQTLEVNQPTQEFYYEVQPKSKFGALFLSSVLPGFGQMYWGNKGRGWLLFLGTAGSLGATMYFNEEFNTQMEVYNDARSNYSRATSVSELNQWQAASEVALEDAIAIRDMRSTMLMVAGGFYAINILDRLFAKSPKKLMKKNTRKEFIESASLRPNGSGATLHIGF